MNLKKIWFRVFLKPVSSLKVLIFSEGFPISVLLEEGDGPRTERGATGSFSPNIS